MKLYAIVVCGVFLLGSGISWAGKPVEETVVCPVGGEKFTTTGTMSCSTLGKTMSFRPITSCDFVTRLPVCPGNGLPVYQEFSDEQVAELKVFLNSDEFALLKRLPPWQRAYGVSKHLGESGTETAFWLLLRAMWYETEKFFENEEALNQLLGESEGELRRASAENRAFLDAIIGYALSAAGRFDEADKRLVRAAKSADAPEILLKYISAIQACQEDMQREGCRPLDRFDP